MKLLQIIFRFEFSDAIETILDNHDITNFTRYSRTEGKDIDGKHYNTQVYPGSVTIVQAQVKDAQVDALLEELGKWRDASGAHKHLQALVLPVEKFLR